MKELNEIKLDALKEVGNIGAGNAATSLAEMTSMQINITVPKVLLDVIDNIAEQMGGASSIAVGIQLGIEGELTGHLMVLMPLEDSFKLIDTMMFMEPGTTQDVDEMGQSALMELGNILASSYLNALSGLTGTYLLPSPPLFAKEEIASLIRNTSNGMVFDVERAIFVETAFTGLTISMKGVIVLLLDHDSLDKLFSILGI